MFQAFSTYREAEKHSTGYFLCNSAKNPAQTCRKFPLTATPIRALELFLTPLLQEPDGTWLQRQRSPCRFFGQSHPAECRPPLDRDEKKIALFLLKLIFAALPRS
jgi:hypothetical protein